jgi:3-phenylpropionate/trans-cinnamate dioxygenase ferredoxin reductase subunit
MESRDIAAVRTVWIAALGVVLAGPVLLRMVLAPPAPLWTQLSTVTGLLALSSIMAAAVLPSRVRSLTRAFGIEGVLEVHRSLGVLAASLVLLHLACVVAADPSDAMLLVPGYTTSASTAATLATVSIGLLVGLALTRSRTKHLPYELWRWSHIGLAGLVVIGSALHVWYLQKLIADAVFGTVLSLFAVLLFAVLLHRWVLRAWTDPAAEFVVREVRPESATVSTLVLDRRRGRHAGQYVPFTFAPGQFAWLRLQRSVAAAEHPFTIASSAADGDVLEFTVRRHTGGFTDGIGGLRPGQPVWVDGPHGAFTSDDGCRGDGLVLIAGGVGVTPMMSILRTAAHRGDDRRFHLVLVVRRRDDVLFRSELAALAGVLDLQVTEVLRSPGGDTAALVAALCEEPAPEKLDYFVCGAPALVATAFHAFDALGVPADQVRTEQFDMA